MSNEFQTGFNEGPDVESGASIAIPQSLEIEPARYIQDLSELNIGDRQKQELLLALWSIMRACVELGFNVDVLELVCGQARENCGNTGETGVE